MSNDMAHMITRCGRAANGTVLQAAGEMERLTAAIKTLLALAPTSDASAQGADESAHRSLRMMWGALSPAQRAILRFVLRHENTGLTYLSISYALELPTLPGAGGSPAPMGRPISDKTVRKHCEQLFVEGVLTRIGERGAIQLTSKGRDLLCAVARSKWSNEVA